MSYLHAWHSGDGIVYFSHNVVCNKWCICTLDTSMIRLFISLHAWHLDDGAIYFRYNVVCKKCRICTLGTRMMGMFIFVIMLFVRSVVSTRLTLGWWNCLFSARLNDGAIYFRYNVVCKKCRICTLGTWMMGLFIFVIMLFVRSVVSTRLTLGWWDCLFSL